ncbi:general stress protein [Kineococcus rhizosphaerae]|uniref:General stress protein 17M-like domain-containing protein n=1 Tax=Kineococcus rhizosphaerae TaxID=559628 RepID=A0A2T0R4B5_9ACTN|nr:general stress protein [Kineococcus rhizosphaerae]PRY15142.1 hypothetical protein CLV37_10568 [Kineococcus rhizosphaerae]
MSNLGPMGPQRISTPTPPQGEAIGRYDTYSEAQRAVDFLSDEHFPVQNVTIVGNGLQMVERVTGRLTYGRAAGAGAASGAWFGLLIGLMLSVFGPGGTGALVTGILVGAGFGMLFGVISYALTGGRRDFTSSSQIVASQYTVLCLPQLAGQARDVLSRLPNGLGKGTGPAAGAAPWGAPEQPPTRPWGPPPGGTQPYMPPPEPGSAPSDQPPPPSFEKEPEPAPMDLSGPTYAEKVEQARRERRAAEARAREEQGGSQ